MGTTALNVRKFSSPKLASKDPWHVFFGPTVFYKILNSLLAGKNQEISHQNPDFFTPSIIGKSDHIDVFTQGSHLQLTGAERQRGAALGLAQATRSSGPRPLHHTGYVPYLTSLVAQMGKLMSEGQRIVQIPTGQVQGIELGLGRNQFSQLSVLCSSLTLHNCLGVILRGGHSVCGRHPLTPGKQEACIWTSAWEGPAPSQLLSLCCRVPIS